MSHSVDAATRWISLRLEAIFPAGQQLTIEQGQVELFTVEGAGSWFCARRPALASTHEICAIIAFL